MKKIDAFLIEVCETSLNFLNDWLGLSQRRVERGLLKVAHGWAILSIVALICQLKMAHTITIALVLLNMWLVNVGFTKKMQQGAQSRALDREFGWWLRYMSLLPTILPALGAAACIHTHDFLQLAWNFCFGMIWVTEFVFCYVIVSNVEGERGRKAKLAWSKIKELFGTEWIPQPVGAGR